MTKPAAHRQGIDLARFIAAYGVVIAHALASLDDWVGHLALGLFLVLTAFLAVKSAERAGGNYAFLPRLRRLILPWLVWSAFFRLLDMAVSDRPDRFQPLTDPWSLLYGSYIHLWFLPFVGLAMVLVGPAVRLVTTPRRLVGATVLVVVLSAPLFWAHETLGLPEPLPQWSFALPVYALGLLTGIAQTLGRPLLPVLAAVLLTALAAWLGNLQPWTLTILVAYAGFALFWHLPVRGAFALHLGQVSFGIYLVHPFLMLVVYKLMGPEVNRLLGGTLAFVMSWAAVAVLRRVPAFARVT